MSGSERLRMIVLLIFEKLNSPGTLIISMPCPRIISKYSNDTGFSDPLSATMI